jgi:hypothetical protein
MRNAHLSRLKSRITAAVFSVFLPVGIALTANVAFADGPLTNGANHLGSIEIGGLDTWTFTATKNDSITISIAEVAGSGPDPEFYPWIRLRGPDGEDLGGGGGTAGDWGRTSAELDVRAPLTGTYSVLVADYPYETQEGTGTYVLTLAKSPGSYTISPGDEGGAMTNTISHAGTIPVGDIDTWVFQANRNDSITINIGEVTGSGPDPEFYPWIRLRGPDGEDLGGGGGTAGDWGTNAAHLDLLAPITGIYTLIVANYPYQGQEGTGRYTVTGSGLRPVGLSLVGILAVAGSTQGSGTFFRTSVQLHNPGTTPISGKLVFHRSGVSGGSNDPALAYTLNAGQTLDYPDLLPAMGVLSGLGSIDIMTTGDPAPIISARIFSDAGENGTAGFFLEPLSPENTLRTGEAGVIIGPADPVKARLNLGIRSLDTGASFVITVRNKNGTLRGTTTKTYAPNYFEQVNANVYLGLSLEGSDTITLTMGSGKAIFYGAQTDNKTQDPSVQYAKKSF